MTLSSTRSILKQQYRSTLSITGEILEVCLDAGLEGILVSEISRKANLSYNAVIENCTKLIDAGLVRSFRNKRYYVFSITEKGIKFFKEFERFKDMIKELNIRF